MRRFSSYGPLNSMIHYHAPRKELITSAYTSLVGQAPNPDGHYITVWAPRQCGKTWVMQQVIQKIKEAGQYACGIFTIERGKKVSTEKSMVELFTEKLTEVFGIRFPKITEFKQIPSLFTSTYFKKPVVLVIDELDALKEEFISDFAAVFRDMFVSRTNEMDKPGQEKTYLLHGLALVGVRGVLGIENETGSPFNVQRNIHISNLTRREVDGLFQWYEKESGQNIAPDVIERLFYETKGQPGLTCWFGELLTETYNEEKNKTVTLDNFEEVYAAAIKILPNNNILNIISKAGKEPYKQKVLELFKTTRKIEFTFDNKQLNYLYMNGVIDHEKQGRTEYYVKFSCPLVQKRLFKYFSNELFPNMGKLHEPFENLGDTIDDATLDPRNLLKRYQTYFKKNRGWLLKNAPRRADLRIYEAVYHFNLYSYLDDFLKTWGSKVIPEFPTGNGKIDLVILHAGKAYGLELKSYTNERNYTIALGQAAKYGKQLNLSEVFLVFFVENIDEENRKKYEKDLKEKDTGVVVKPVFIETGN